MVLLELSFAVQPDELSTSNLLRPIQRRHQADEAKINWTKMRTWMLQQQGPTVMFAECFFMLVALLRIASAFR